MVATKMGVKNWSKLHHARLLIPKIENRDGGLRLWIMVRPRKLLDTIDFLGHQAQISTFKLLVSSVIIQYANYYCRIRISKQIEIYSVKRRRRKVSNTTSSSLFSLLRKIIISSRSIA